MKDGKKKELDFVIKENYFILLHSFNYQCATSVSDLQKNKANKKKTQTVAQGINKCSIENVNASETCA